MRWVVHGERELYRDRWVDVRSADVELPDGRHLDHRLVRTDPGAGAVVLRNGAVLLLWRHRFITDTWGWEIPIGGLNPGEKPNEAAAREVEEETGWRPTDLTPLVYVQPSPGLMTSEHTIFLSNAATHIGQPEDGFESERIEWVPLSDVQRLIRIHDITSATTATALLYTLLQTQL